MEIWFKTEESSRTGEKKPEITDLFSAFYIVLTDAFIFCYWKTNESSCPTHVWLCGPMDHSSPGSSVHGIFPGKRTGLGCISFSRGSSWLRNQTCASYIGSYILYHWATWEALSWLFFYKLLELLAWEKNTETEFHIVLSRVTILPYALHTPHTHTLLLTSALLNAAQNTRTEPSVEHCERSLSLCCTMLSRSVVSDCVPVDCSPPGSSVHGDSPGKNTGVGYHAFLQGIFPTQRSNPGLLHCQQILYHLSH